MEYTEEQQKDFQERASAFGKEFAEMLDELKKKHQCEVKYSVVSIPTQSGVFALGVSENIADLKYRPVPSPTEFVQENGTSSTN